MPIYVAFIFTIRDIHWLYEYTGKRSLNSTPIRNGTIFGRLKRASSSFFSIFHLYRTQFHIRLLYYTLAFTFVTPQCLSVPAMRSKKESQQKVFGFSFLRLPFILLIDIRYLGNTFIFRLSFLSSFYLSLSLSFAYFRI